MQVSISFFLAGRPLCTCLWWHVPRQGERVRLGAHDARERTVLRVVWGYPAEAPLATGTQSVRIDLSEEP